MAIECRYILTSNTAIGVSGRSLRPATFREALQAPEHIDVLLEMVVPCERFGMQRLAALSGSTPSSLMTLCTYIIAQSLVK